MKGLIRTARSVAGWFRAVWPPQWIVALLLLTCGLCELIYLAAYRAFGENANPQQFHLPRDATLLLGAALYGVYRGLGFHPVFDPAYLDWLRLTPWKAGKLLPLGTVHIVAQDGAFLALLLALGKYHAVLSPAAIPLTMLVAYCGSVLFVLCYTGPTWSVYALGFGLALVGRLAWVSPWAALTAIVPVAVFSQVALSLSLAAFPWQQRLDAIRARLAQPRDNSTKPTRQTQSLPPEGEFVDLLRLWPRSALHVDGRVRLFTPFDFFMLSLVAGFVASCASAGAPPEPQGETPLVLALCAWVIFATAVVRLVVYVSRHSPPISLAGRLVTGRWLIPGYDVVFLTPLAVLVMGTGTTVLLSMVDAPLSITVGLTTSVCLLVAFLGGPNLRRWQLTGPCRLTRTATALRSAEQL